jgi:hypothetical protein
LIAKISAVAVQQQYGSIACPKFVATLLFFIILNAQPEIQIFNEIYYHIY